VVVGVSLYLIYRGNDGSFKNLTFSSAMGILATEMTSVCYRRTPVETTATVATSMPTQSQRHFDAKYQTTATHSDEEEIVELAMYPAATATYAKV
jgi:hypothetical protein